MKNIEYDRNTVEILATRLHLHRTEVENVLAEWNELAAEVSLKAEEQERTDMLGKIAASKNPDGFAQGDIVRLPYGRILWECTSIMSDRPVPMGLRTVEGRRYRRIARHEYLWALNNLTLVRKATA